MILENLEKDLLLQNNIFDISSSLENHSVISHIHSHIQQNTPLSQIASNGYNATFNIISSNLSGEQNSVNMQNNKNKMAPSNNRESSQEKNKKRRIIYVIEENVQESQENCNQGNSNTQNEIAQLKIQLKQLNEDYNALKLELEALKGKNLQCNSSFERYSRFMFPTVHPNFLPYFQINSRSMYFVLSLPKNLPVKFYNANFMYLDDVSQEFAAYMGYSPSQVLNKCCSLFVPNYSQSQLSSFSMAFFF